jgi:hypothetical protein
MSGKGPNYRPGCPQILDHDSSAKTAPGTTARQDQAEPHRHHEPGSADCSEPEHIKHRFGDVVGHAITSYPEKISVRPQPVENDGPRWIRHVLGLWQLRFSRQDSIRQVRHRSRLITAGQPGCNTLTIALARSTTDSERPPAACSSSFGKVPVKSIRYRLKGQEPTAEKWNEILPSGSVSDALAAVVRCVTFLRVRRLLRR